MNEIAATHMICSLSYVSSGCLSDLFMSRCAVLVVKLFRHGSEVVSGAMGYYLAGFMLRCGNLTPPVYGGPV